ncbi:MAG: CvpA family protein [Sulfuritalea sp.]|nr:CvpA family protein [Sulfuritalea sp.]
MTPFDYFALAVTSISLLVGISRGVVSEVLALAAWVAAFFAARAWAVPAGNLLLADGPDPLWRQLAGFVVVFVAVLVLFALLRGLMGLLLKAAGLRPLDRALGAFFGAARGVLVLLALILLAGLTPLPQQKWWREAAFAPPLETAVVAIKPWLPPELARKVHYR